MDRCIVSSMSHSQSWRAAIAAARSASSPRVVRRRAQRIERRVLHRSRNVRRQHRHHSASRRGRWRARQALSIGKRISARGTSTVSAWTGIGASPTGTRYAQWCSAPRAAGPGRSPMISNGAVRLSRPTLRSMARSNSRSTSSRTSMRSCAARIMKWQLPSVCTTPTTRQRWRGTRLRPVLAGRVTGRMEKSGSVGAPLPVFGLRGT